MQHTGHDTSSMFLISASMTERSLPNKLDRVLEDIITLSVPYTKLDEKQGAEEER